MMAPLAWSGVAASALVSAAWEGMVLAGLVAVCLRMLPGITAAARSLVWTAVMLAVCGLPLVHLGATGAGGQGSGRMLLDARLGLALVLVWLALSLIRAGQLVRSALWLRGISRRAVATADADSMPSGSRQASLCVSDEVDRPCVVGFFRPRILVPADLFGRISEGELRQIVLHEMEHLRRRDDWTNLLQKLSLVAFPLNPALIWIERQLCVERELACDDQVLKATGARKAYAACLANLAEHSLVRRGVSLALGAWERQSEVVRRVHRILSRNEREMGRRQVAGVVAAMMLGVAGVADGLAHVPALVGFGPDVAAVAGSGVPQGLKPGFVGGLYGTGEPVPSTSLNGSVQRGEVAARATDVVFHPAAVKRHAAVVKGRKPIVDASKRASNMGHPEPLTGDEPMVVMVTWSASAQPVIVQDLQFTYAAVPTRNGWLFVQL